MHKFPVQIICWILPGTSMDLNFAGRSAALWGTCKSPRANTSTILANQNMKARRIKNLKKQNITHQHSITDLHKKIAQQNLRNS